MNKNSEAYKQALAEANKIYGTKSNIFRSSYIVKKYKQFGGKFDDNKSGNLDRWFQEQWVLVVPYLEKNKVVLCGSSSGGEACRPLLRINKQTPLTIGELLNMHAKKDILKIAYLKQSKPNIYIDWKSLTYTEK